MLVLLPDCEVLKAWLPLKLMGVAFPLMMSLEISAE